MQKKLFLSGICISLLFTAGMFDSSLCRADDRVEFTLKKVVDGAPFCFDSNKGKCTIIVFGSLYCKPCIELIPVLNKLYEDYKASGFLAIGVDVDMTTEEEKLKSFVAEKKISFPFLRDISSIAKKYKVFILPTTLAVDANGEVIKRYTGFQSYETLEKQIKKVLGTEKEKGTLCK